MTPPNPGYLVFCSFPVTVVPVTVVWLMLCEEKGWVCVLCPVFIFFVCVCVLLVLLYAWFPDREATADRRSFTSYYVFLQQHRC